MGDPLDGLSRRELLACRVTEKVLGASAQVWDTSGRQSAVGAMLTLSDGRHAALEVTWVDTDQALHLEGELSRSDFHLPAVGRWSWDITIDSVRDLPRLRRRYARLIGFAEPLGLTRPEQILWYADVMNVDLAWLGEHPGVSMLGHLDVPAREGDRVGGIVIMPAVGGGDDQPQPVRTWRAARAALR